MPTIFRFPGVALVVAISVVARPSAQAPSIAGRITDLSQAVLPGVMVTIVPERGGVAQHTTTDAAGRYRFEAVPDGTYRIDGDLLGFDLDRRNHVRVRAGTAATGDVILKVSAICECIGSRIKAASTVLTGRVVDEANHPLPHATLEVVAPSGLRETAYADREGRFVLRAPANDPWQLTAFDSGFEPGTLPVSSDSANPLLFRLRFAGTEDVADRERLARDCRCPGNVFAHEGR